MVKERICIYHKFFLNRKPEYIKSMNKEVLKLRERKRKEIEAERSLMRSKARIDHSNTSVSKRSASRSRRSSRI